MTKYHTPTKATIAKKPSTSTILGLKQLKKSPFSKTAIKHSFPKKAKKSAESMRTLSTTNSSPEKLAYQTCLDHDSLAPKNLFD